MPIEYYDDYNDYNDYNIFNYLFFIIKKYYKFKQELEK